MVFHGCPNVESGFGMGVPRLANVRFYMGLDCAPQEGKGLSHLMPPAFKQLLLHANEKVVYAREPISFGKESTKLLMDNLCAHIYPDNSSFEDKVTQWYQDLLLNQDKDLNDIIGFDNWILIAFRMCPPCELLVPKEELSHFKYTANAPTYFIRCPSTEIWETADF